MAFALDTERSLHWFSVSQRLTQQTGRILLVLKALSHKIRCLSHCLNSLNQFGYARMYM